MLEGQIWVLMSVKDDSGGGGGISGGSSSNSSIELSPRQESTYSSSTTFPSDLFTLKLPQEGAVCEGGRSSPSVNPSSKNPHRPT